MSSCNGPPTQKLGASATKRRSRAQGTGASRTLSRRLPRELLLPVAHPALAVAPLAQSARSSEHLLDDSAVTGVPFAQTQTHACKRAHTHTPAHSRSRSRSYTTTPQPTHEEILARDPDADIKALERYVSQHLSISLTICAVRIVTRTVLVGFC